MFSRETYVARRGLLKKQISSGLIVLPANGESSINYADNWYRFRQDSNFLYYFGLSVPDLVGIIDCESGDEILFGFDQDIDGIIWTGPLPTVQELAESVGINKTANLSKLSTLISNANNQGRQIHFTPPYRAEQLMRLSEWTGWKIGELQSKSSIGLIKAIISQRAIKTSEEITEVERAVNITGGMHLAAMQYARQGMREYEIVAKVEEAALAGGGNLAFPIILTKNGQTLHNHYHGNLVNGGEMILCDAGAELESGYCGDMTRTFPVGNRFSTRQKEIYNIVLSAHLAAVAVLKPGVEFKDIHLLACAALFEQLKSLGLTKGDTREAVNAGAHAMFFQCGLGHMMGLDVHDMENLGEQYVGYTEPKSTQFGLKSLRLGRTLEPGFVLTIEPGIYFIPQLIDRWEAEGKFKEFINYKVLKEYSGFGGIRIEEDFVITENGAQLLGRPVAKSIDEIEAIRG